MHLFFSIMNPMTSAGPQANTVFVMAPHNGYPVIPGSRSQVPQYPLNQPQVHTISGNLHCMEPPVYMQPDQRSFKEGNVLGVSEISHCVYWPQGWNQRKEGGLETQKLQIQQVGLELTQPCQIQVY